VKETKVEKIPTLFITGTGSQIFSYLSQRILYLQNWIMSRNNTYFLIPVLMQELCSVPDMGVEDTERAVDAAYSAFQV
jgi:hypothetical protein